MQTYQAPALEKGLDILERLANEEVGLTIAQISRDLGRNHNELYRMVVVLERRGYLNKSSTDRYSLSGKLFDLAMRRAPHRDLHDAALPVMRRLARELGQSCHLAVISGTDIVVVARMESPDQLGFSLRVGYRRSLVLSTSGRILYACMDEARRHDLKSVLPEQVQYTKNWQDFLADVDKVIKDGFLARTSAHISSITDIGAPVFDDANGGAVASLTVPWVKEVGLRCTIDEAAARIRQCALEISEGINSTASVGTQMLLD